MLKLKYYDFLSKCPQMYLNGSSRFKSNIGAALSFLLIFLGLSGFIFFFNRLLYRLEPNVSMSTKYNPYGSFKLNTSEIVIAFGISDSVGIPLDYSYFSAYAQNWNYILYKNNTVTGDSIIKYNLSISRCNNTQSVNGRFNSLYKEQIFTNYYCLDPNQIIEIKSPFASSYNYSYINFYITHCTGRSDCKNSSEINKKLTSYYFDIYTINHYLDNENYENPIQSYINLYTDMSSASFFKRTYFYLKNIIYKSDRGLVFNEIEEKTETLFKESKTIMDFRDIKLFSGKLLYQFTYCFNSEGTEELINRNYKRIQNIIAEIGGFINALRIISIIFLDFYYDLTFYYNILNKFTLLYNNEIINNENTERIVSVNIPFRNKIIQRNNNHNISEYKIIDKNLCTRIFLLSKKSSPYIKAKNLIINYYFDILNMIYIKNELKALKFLLLKNDDLKFCQKISNIISLECDYKKTEGISSLSLETEENKKLKEFMLLNKFMN